EGRSVRVVAALAGQPAAGEGRRLEVAAREHQALHVADEPDLVARLARHEDGARGEERRPLRRRPDPRGIELEPGVALQVAGGAALHPLDARPGTLAVERV